MVNLLHNCIDRPKKSGEFQNYYFCCTITDKMVKRNRNVNLISNVFSITLRTSTMINTIEWGIRRYR